MVDYIDREGSHRMVGQGAADLMHYFMTAILYSVIRQET